MLVAVLLTTVFFAFTWNTAPDYENLIGKDRQLDFVKKTDSNELKNNLADVFTHHFDRVDRVDIHHNLVGDYHYYVVYGQKEKQATAQLIHVDKKMVDKQYFPNRKALGIAPNELIIDCYWQEKTKDNCDLKITRFGTCGYARDELLGCVEWIKPVQID